MTEQEKEPVTLWTNDAHLSDRDQFAIGFAEWLKHSDYESLESTNNVHEYGNIWNNESMTYAISELLDLYKQSLTKTDKV